jgi:hypothetical protein
VKVKTEKRRRKNAILRAMAGAFATPEKLAPTIY